MREEGEGGVATSDPNLVISSLASKGQDLKLRSL